MRTLPLELKDFSAMCGAWDVACCLTFSLRLNPHAAAVAAAQVSLCLVTQQTSALPCAPAWRQSQLLLRIFLGVFTIRRGRLNSTISRMCPDKCTVMASLIGFMERVYYYTWALKIIVWILGNETSMCKDKLLGSFKSTKWNVTYLATSM